MRENLHKTVLLKEIVENLNLADNSIIVDATFGGGGHSEEILKKFPKTKIIALDQDKGVSSMVKDKRISFHNSNFRDLDKVLEKEKIKKIDGIIFDLGLSSNQLESSGRGFSFMKDEPLLMTMKENPGPEDLTAEQILNYWEEKNLADIFYGYGEEKFSRRIARAIVQARLKTKIKSTFDLVKIIETVVPSFYRRGKIHFATKTFQALRIAVNDELRVLTEGLEKGFVSLKIGGRMLVISFHSLEDRIVKRFYNQKKQQKEAVLINKKPILATSEEIKNNPRSRSAKLRILEKNDPNKSKKS